MPRIYAALFICVLFVVFLERTSTFLLEKVNHLFGGSFYKRFALCCSVMSGYERL